LGAMFSVESLIPGSLCGGPPPPTQPPDPAQPGRTRTADAPSTPAHAADRHHGPPHHTDNAERNVRCHAHGGGSHHLASPRQRAGPSPTPPRAWLTRDACSAWYGTLRTRPTLSPHRRSYNQCTRLHRIVVLATPHQGRDRWPSASYPPHRGTSASLPISS